MKLSRKEKEELYIQKATELQKRWRNPIPVNWASVEALTDQRLNEVITETTNQLRFEKVWGSVVAVLLSPLYFVHYALVAWGYVAFVDRSASFWAVLALLSAARLFFYFVDFLLNEISWRLFGRRIAYRTVFTFLTDNKFPMRKYVYDPAVTYLFRFRDRSDTPDVSDETRGAARQLEAVLDFLDETTKLHSWRARSVFEQAVAAYAPRERALYKDWIDARHGI